MRIGCDNCLISTKYTYLQAVKISFNVIESNVMSIGRVHIITDYYFQQRWPASQLARLAIEGGADTIQFRQKRGPVTHKLHEAERVSRICATAGVPLIVNDEIAIGLAVGAAGIHLGQLDFPIGVARRILPTGMILGATCTTLAEARHAVDEGADYLGFGPVFHTSSKDNLASVKGLDGLSRVCAAVDVPVIAIAGITPERVPEVLAAGAYGVAVMTVVSLASDPVLVVSQIVDAVQTAVESSRP